MFWVFNASRCQHLILYTVQRRPILQPQLIFCRLLSHDFQRWPYSQSCTHGSPLLGITWEQSSQIYSLFINMLKIHHQRNVPYSNQARLSQTVPFQITHLFELAHPCDRPNAVTTLGNPFRIHGGHTSRLFLSGHDLVRSQQLREGSPNEKALFWRFF